MFSVRTRCIPEKVLNRDLCESFREQAEVFAIPMGTVMSEAITFDAALRPRPPDVPSLKLRQNIEWMECESLRRAQRSVAGDETEGTHARTSLCL